MRKNEKSMNKQKEETDTKLRNIGHRVDPDKEIIKLIFPHCKTTFGSP